MENGDENQILYMRTKEINESMFMTYIKIITKTMSMDNVVNRLINSCQ